MSKVVEKLAASGELTDEQVRRVGRAVAEMRKAAQADPSLREQYIQKIAGFFSSLGKRLSDPEALAGVAHNVISAAALGAGATALGGGYKTIKNALTKGRDYRNMLEATPELKDLPEADAKTVQLAFNTLHKFNPEYASDPFVAGAFVRQMADKHMMNMQTVNQLVQSRKHLSDMQRGTSVTEWGRMLGPPGPSPEDTLGSRLNALRATSDRPQGMSPEQEKAWNKANADYLAARK